MEREGMRRMTEAFDAIGPPNTLHFCTRCGGGVEPYLANEGGMMDFPYSDSYSEALRPEGDERESLSHYFCSGCDARWTAIGCGDTGMLLACGHFMPFYSVRCAVCGRRTDWGVGKR